MDESFWTCFPKGEIVSPIDSRNSPISIWLSSTGSFLIVSVGVEPFYRFIKCKIIWVLSNESYQMTHVNLSYCPELFIDTHELIIFNSGISVDNFSLKVYERSQMTHWMTHGVWLIEMIKRSFFFISVNCRPTLVKANSYFDNISSKLLQCVLNLSLSNLTS